MNWHRYRDYLPDRDTFRDHLPDTDRLSGYLPSLPSRSSLPTFGLFDRRRQNTELTLAVGVGAAALIGLCAGAYLISRDRANAEEDDTDAPEGRSDFGHPEKSSK